MHNEYNFLHTRLKVNYQIYGLKFLINNIVKMSTLVNMFRYREVIGCSVLNLIMI